MNGKSPLLVFSTEISTHRTQTLSSQARQLPADSVAVRERRDALLMTTLWLFIGLVSAYDTYLSIKFQELLPIHELNPVGRWLLEIDGGSCAAFMGCKFLGTSLALGILQLLYFAWRTVALTVATVLAALQAMLAWYLTYGG